MTKETLDKILKEHEKTIIMVTLYMVKEQANGAVGTDCYVQLLKILAQVEEEMLDESPE